MEAAGWPEYQGDLLLLALELGDRLLPAFDTASGIPLSWINLAKVWRSSAACASCLKGCTEPCLVSTCCAGIVCGRVRQTCMDSMHGAASMLSRLGEVGW